MDSLFYRLTAQENFSFSTLAWSYCDRYQTQRVSLGRSYNFRLDAFIKLIPHVLTWPVQKQFCLRDLKLYFKVLNLFNLHLNILDPKTLRPSELWTEVIKYFAKRYFSPSPPDAWYPGCLWNVLYKLCLCFSSTVFLLLNLIKHEEKISSPTWSNFCNCLVFSLRSSSSSKAKFVKCVHSHLTVPDFSPGSDLQPSLDQARKSIAV